jgi:hypothetical protein
MVKIQILVFEFDIFEVSGTDGSGAIYSDE